MTSDLTSEAVRGLDVLLGVLGGHVDVVKRAKRAYRQRPRSSCRRQRIASYYINGIVYAEKTHIKPFLSKFRAKSKNFENLRVLKKPIFSKSRVTKRPSEIKIR